MTNILVGSLISRAFPELGPIPIVGLPEWAATERYDVIAMSSLTKATPAERASMLRAMLVDRFKLAVHIEKREQPAFDLVLARSDGRLGPGIKRVSSDCDLIAQRASSEAGSVPVPQLPDFKVSPPPCTLRIVGALMRDRLGDGLGREGDLMEGETTMDNLATTLLPLVGRFVVNKTGLPGTYSIRMNFDGSRRGPEVDPADSAVSVFTALREQLGLKLDSSSARLDTLVIDRLEQPTEN